MKQITHWASRHILLSRIIISLGLLLLYGIGVLYGSLLYANIRILPSIIFVVIPLGLLIITMIYYPRRQRRKEIYQEDRGYFRKWKVFDFVLAMSMLPLGVHLGYDVHEKSFSENKTLVQVSSLISTVPMVKIINIDRDQDKRHLRLLSRLQKAIKSKLSRFNRWFTSVVPLGQKIAFVLVMGLISTILGYGLALLSCQISCSGYTVLAVIAAILGVALIFGFIYYMAFKIVRSNNLKRNLNLDLKAERKEGVILALMTVFCLVVALGLVFLWG